MTDPRGIVDFFALEAGEYLERMDAWLAGAMAAATGRAPDVEPFIRSARALRGAATMARQSDLASLADALARVGQAVQQGRLGWTEETATALAATVESFRRLLRSARSWSAVETAEAHERARRLGSLLGGQETPPPGAGRPVIPIRLLAPADGEQLLHRNPAPAITADQRFRQAAVPLASALRRAIGEARQAGVRDDAARLTLGEDLRAALRDLRDLAESYDVQPVVSFCTAREEGLAALDPRALDTVDGAATALIESAGATWSRATPAGGVPAVGAEARGTPALAQAAIPAPVPVLAAEAPALAPPAGPSVAVAEPEPARAPAPPAAEQPRPVATHVEPGPNGPPLESRVRTPASGAALVELIETGLTGMADLTDSLAGSMAALFDGPSDAAGAADGVVPIESLLYRGRAALDRAREVRDTLRAAPAPPDPVLLDELYDLLDLAVEP